MHVYGAKHSNRTKFYYWVIPTESIITKIKSYFSCMLGAITLKMETMVHNNYRSLLDTYKGKFTFNFTTIVYDLNVEAQILYTIYHTSIIKLQVSLVPMHASSEPGYEASYRCDSRLSSVLAIILSVHGSTWQADEPHNNYV